MSIEEIRVLINLPKHIDKLIYIVNELKNRRDQSKIIYLILSDLLCSLYGYNTENICYLNNNNITADNIYSLIGNNSVIFYNIADVKNIQLSLILPINLDISSSFPLPEYTVISLLTSIDNNNKTCLLPYFNNRIKDKTLQLYLPEFFILFFLRYVTFNKKNDIKEAHYLRYFGLLNQYLEYLFPKSGYPWITGTIAKTSLVSFRLAFVLFSSELWLTSCAPASALTNFQVPQLPLLKAITVCILSFQQGMEHGLNNLVDDDTTQFFKSLYSFLLNAFAQWPSTNLSELEIVVNLWLRMLQPWYYSAGLNESLNINIDEKINAVKISEEINKWKSYIQFYYPFYSFLLSYFIQLTLKLVPARIECQRLIDTVLTLFNNPVLNDLLSQMDNDFKTNSPKPQFKNLNSRVQLLVPQTTKSASSMEVKSYTIFPGIKPITVYGQNDVKEEVFSKNPAINLYTMLNLAHESLKFWDHSQKTPKFEIYVSLVQPTWKVFASKLIRNYLPLDVSLVAQILHKLKAEETEADRKKRVKIVWRLLFCRIKSIVRIVRGARVNENANDLLKKIQSVFHLSSIDIGRSTNSKEHSFQNIQHPDTRVGSDGVARLTEIGKRQIFSGLQSSSRLHVPILQQGSGLAPLSHEFPLLIKYSKKLEIEVTNYTGINISLRFLASYYTWFRIFIILIVMLILRRLFF